jgi:PAS domain S-box-containing protein
MPLRRLQSLKQPFQWLLGLARQGRLVTVVIALTAGVVLFLTMQVAGRMNTLRSAPQDNVQWSLAQLDVELLALDIATNRAVGGKPADLAQLRQRFDVFYSRVKSTAMMPIFRGGTSGETATKTITGMLATLDQVIAVVDAPDSVLAARTNELATTFDQLRPLSRQVTLTGVKLYAAQADASRAEFSELLWKTALFNALLVLALGTTMIFLLRQIAISKRRADALQISSDRNASTLVTSLDAIIIMNLDGTIVEFNEAATQAFGYSRLAAIGAKLDELVVPPRYREAHRKGLAHFKATGQTKVVGAGRIELSALRSDGTEFPVEFSLGVTNSPEGQLVIAFMRDISKRVEQENELRQARDQALQAAQTKSQFLAMMSHEMRTPLNGVMAVLDLLSASKLNGKQKKLVSTATTSAEILKQHVDDVLDLTRIQAGKFELFPRVFDMAELLEEVQSINVAVAAKRNNRIILDIDIPQAYFVADRKRIHQVLTNLVGNAIKFTQDGRITISAKPVSVRADLVTVEFRVKDTGIGIPPDQQSRIFEDFVTLDNSYQRISEGAGLGLPICRNIVEAMGGTIGVQSDVNSGSSFWFHLPLKVGPATKDTSSTQKKSVVKPRQFKHLKVLVVEDNETNRFVAGEMLNAQGCEVVMARDGAEGAAIAEAQRFDLILMDLSMPRMNGWDAARRIRSLANAKSHQSPIFALTAHALPEEQEALLKAGMQGCVLKPLRAKELGELLHSVAENLHQQPKKNPRSKASNKPDEKVIDKAVVSEMREVLGPDLFMEKLNAFLNEQDNALENITQLFAAGNLPDVARAAHKLAGSAAVFGATHLQASLNAVEHAAMRNSPQNIAKLLDDARLATATRAMYQALLAA